MSCYRPIKAWSHGKGQPVSFWASAGSEEAIGVPCGRCFGCRMDRVRRWSIRCQHEASCWDFNAFVTLTYDEGHLPPDGGLVPEHVQRWLKRLRKVLSGVQESPDGRKPIRFFLVGEYGERRARPHYHALLFNCRLPEERRVGKELFEADVLSSTWAFGSAAFGRVTPASASYTAGYSLKKVYGSRADSFYEVVDPSTGECITLQREFCRMSLKPGIGFYWYEKYRADLRHGFVVRDGQKFGVPRFYRSKLKDDLPFHYDEGEFARAEFVTRADMDARSEERLHAAEVVAEARHSLFSRR